MDLKVINLFPKERRIGLSLKALVAEQERAAAPEEDRSAGSERRSDQPPRPRRERASRRQMPAHEETVTTLGTLLKEEMGRSNLESSESVESPENVESSEGTENSEN